MKKADSPLIYGVIPPGIVDIPEQVTQCSFMIPGSLSLEELEPQSIKHIVIYAPPGTLERRYILAHALNALVPDGELLALSPKDKGGSRMAKELKQFGCDVLEDSRRHHRFCIVKRPENILNVEEILIEGGPQKAIHGLWTQPGIFSWDRQDPGTTLLLDHLPVFSGKGVDLGCGLGILGKQVLLSSNVASLLLIDIDRRAIEAAKRNIPDARASFLWADIRHTPLPVGEMDFVVMNPPFHDTGLEDKNLGQQCIEAASSMLRTGGQCWLTANLHLPYESTLKQHFTSAKRVAEANGYKIYRAEK